jgi:adenylosuccinate lyase
MLALPGLFPPGLDEFVHFSTTSEDCNNLAYALMLLDARDSLFDAKMQEVCVSVCVCVCAWVVQLGCEV